MKKRLLILSYSPLHSDPRVRRQIFALQEEFDIVAAGFTDPCIQGVRFHPVRREPTGLLARLSRLSLLFTRQFDRYFWSAGRRGDALDLGETSFDAVIANDLIALPVGLKVGGRAVYGDLHEYSPEQFGDQLFWRTFYRPFYRYLGRTYLKQARMLSTVSEGIADEYERNFSVERPQVVTNAPFCDESLEPTMPSPGRVAMIHHGVAAHGRRLELMIDMMDFLDARFSLDFMLVRDGSAYYDRLVDKARGKRVRFLDPVPTEQITEFLNSYDVGLYLLAPNNFNRKFALPNKFFEFLQAKLVIAIGPSPEMAAIVKREGLGIVAESFEPRALAASLQQLDEQRIIEIKSAAVAASSRYSYSHEQRRIRQIVHFTVGIASTP